MGCTGWPILCGRGGRPVLKPGEHRYLRFLVILLCLLATVQGLMRNQEIRRLLNESVRLEGEPLARAVSGLTEPANTWLSWPVLSEGEPQSQKVAFFYLKFIGGSDRSVWVLVNGRPQKRITREDGVVAARHGDLIEVAVESGWASIVVSDVQGHVVSPQPGTWIKGQGILLLGRVKILCGGD